ncbi:MAG: glycoside hydrolase family 3 N-terminal domain-containing protein [Beutenbergiaceae bacterium]
MKALSKKGAAVFAAGSLLLVAGCTTGTDDSDANGSDAASGDYTTTEMTDGTTSYTLVENPDGATLSFATGGPIGIVEEEVDGVVLAFKDSNANGELDPFEDWRNDAATRSADLAAQLGMEQLTGLSLFSFPQSQPGDGVTDPQMVMLDTGLRSVLVNGDGTIEERVTWSNGVQAYAESLASPEAPFIPVNVAVNPQSMVSYTANTIVSKWPSLLGLAATGSEETMMEFARISSAEYRALGFTDALAPQIDLASEPRWLRLADTLGEDPELAASLAAAYVEGYQNTYDDSGAAIGWGSDSVPTTIKHFPGDGPGEGGRESHLEIGAYAVYPGGNLDQHVSVFEAAIASANVMTSYSVGVDGNGEPLFDQEVGTSYDEGKIDLLREGLGYEGVIVTDWLVFTSIYDEGATYGTGWGRPVEEMTIPERLQNIIELGTDQIGGLGEAEPMRAAYALWDERFEAGELDVDAQTRWAESAARIMTPYFEAAFYDHPYLELENSLAVVGSEDAVAAGLQAQLASVVMTQNDGTIAEGMDWSDKTVYIPQTFQVEHGGALRTIDYSYGPVLDLDVASQYFGEVVTDEVELDENDQVVSFTAPDLSEVDLVLVGMRSPNNGDTVSSAGYDTEAGQYYPLSLQYEPYTADNSSVRTDSISGLLQADGTRENRSYFGATSEIYNAADYEAFKRAQEAIAASGNDIPVIVALNAFNPTVPVEFAPTANAVIVGFGTSSDALIQVATSNFEPQGMLPVTFPASMAAVEAQLEDVPLDTEPYVDDAGNSWATGYGLNWSGVLG